MTTRETDYQGWELPDTESEPDSDHENWDDYIDAIIDDIDAQTFARFLASDDPPTPGASIADRFLTNDTDTDWVTLQFDTGSAFDQIKTAQRWDVVPWAWADRDQEVFGVWAFHDDAGRNGLATLDADISGRAQRVGKADEAETALDADAFEDNPPESFAATTAERTVTESWTHAAEATYEEGLAVSGGTFALPVYDEPAEPAADDDNGDS